MGGAGKSSGTQNTTPTLTQEQKDAIATQTGFLKDVAIPAYTNTVGQAKDVMGNVMPAVTSAANTASNVASGLGALSGAVGSNALLTGTSGIESLFNPQYEEQQVRASMQPGIEEARNLMSQQTAQFGGAGSAGSTRQAIAQKNLEDLTAQRLATAAANARAGVQANKLTAGNELANIGNTNLTNALGAVSSRIGFAGAPQDVLSKYASVVYGIPQGSTTPNFTGTQGSTGTTSGSGKGFKIGG
jgi:hypothetical protein